MAGTSRCRSCGQSIRWGQTAGGKVMPIDPESVAGGNVFFDAESGDALVLTREQVADTVARLGDVLHTSHFATCPDHQKWRKSNAERHRTRLGCRAV